LQGGLATIAIDQNSRFFFPGGALGLVAWALKPPLQSKSHIWPHFWTGRFTVQNQKISFDFGAEGTSRKLAVSRFSHRAPFFFQPNGCEPNCHRISRSFRPPPRLTQPFRSNRPTRDAEARTCPLGTSSEHEESPENTRGRGGGRGRRRRCLRLRRLQRAPMARVSSRLRGRAAQCTLAAACLQGRIYCGRARHGATAAAADRAHPERGDSHTRWGAGRRPSAGFCGTTRTTNNIASTTEDWAAKPNNSKQEEGPFGGRCQTFAVHCARLCQRRKACGRRAVARARGAPHYRRGGGAQQWRRLDCMLQWPFWTKCSTT
jgi:hypothetical protein